MKIAFVASETLEAQQALERLTQRYGQSDFPDAEYVVPLGGDGTTLKTLSGVLPGVRTPVFAMRLGRSVGFLGNRFSLADLPQRLRDAAHATIHPLQADARHTDGARSCALGINEVTLIRQGQQAARLRLAIDGVERDSHFIGDGLLVATPVGSTGYNRSAGGPNLPLDSSLLALTGVAAYPTSKWSNLVLHDNAVIDIQVLDAGQRLVRLEAGGQELPNVAQVRVARRGDVALTLLFDQNRRVGAATLRRW